MYTIVIFIGYCGIILFTFVIFLFEYSDEMRIAILIERIASVFADQIHEQWHASALPCLV